MRTKTIVMMTVIIALLLGPQVFAQTQLQIQNIQSQIVGSPDSAGNVQFNVTATAFNPTMYGTQFSVVVQGLGSNGSPLTNVTLWGRIEGRETGTLVGNGSMPLGKYESIANWVQVK
jgi:hypothetical protein